MHVLKSISFLGLYHPKSSSDDTQYSSDDTALELYHPKSSMYRPKSSLTIFKKIKTEKRSFYNNVRYLSSSFMV